MSIYKLPSFKNKNLLFVSLRHKSIFNKKLCFESERLEFLGDAIISAVITELLFNEYSNESEGILSEKRAALINKDTLAEVFRSIQQNIIPFGEIKEFSNKVQCQIFESIIGAYYMDSGFEKTKEYISLIFESKISSVVSDNYKSQLQIITYNKYKQYPEYLILNELGPSNNKTYEIAVKINNNIISIAEGSSIKTAEKLAARKALEIIK